MSAIPKRPYTPDELGEVLSRLISGKEQERSRCYISADRASIDKELKALKQLKKQEEFKVRNNQKSIL